MAEGVLVGDEVNAEFAATGIETADFFTGERAPALPDRFIFFVGERVFGVELKLIYFQIGEAFGKVEECFNFWDTAAGDIEHDTAAREIRPVADLETGQAAAIFAQELAEGGGGGPQAGVFAKGNGDAAFINRERITFGMRRRGLSADNFDAIERAIFWQGERAAQKLQ